MRAPITPLQPEAVLSPLLASLPASSNSPTPPSALLPSLSPILRQRVQLLPSSPADPWLPLLCYDSSQATKLQTVVKTEKFEPHPVSGEIEVDWSSSNVSNQYRRLDEETFQSLVSLKELQLVVTLIWCTNDAEGGSDGWRIGEVAVWDPTSASWGYDSIALAEDAFVSQSQRQQQQQLSHNLNAHARPNGTNSLLTPDAEAEEDDDDDYWAQYDNTPARTPAPKHSPAPPGAADGNLEGAGDEEGYYAQYASVQPAMDNHDPDEAQQNGHVETSLGKDEVLSDLQSQLQFRNPSQSPGHQYVHSNEVNPWSNDDNTDTAMPTPTSSSAFSNGISTKRGREAEADPLAMPRPSSASSTGSSGSDTVARLEKRAAKEAQSEVGIKQHIGTTMKSLYRLARVAGIDRKEFERIVMLELEFLGVMDEGMGED